MTWRVNHRYEVYRTRLKASATQAQLVADSIIPATNSQVRKYAVSSTSRTHNNVFEHWILDFSDSDNVRELNFAYKPVNNTELHNIG